MEPFEVFLERRARNPLRKQELADSGEMSNIDYIDTRKTQLSPETEEAIQNMVDAGVEPERVEAYRQGKLKTRESELRKAHLRTNPKKKFTPITNHMGFKIYADELGKYEMEKNFNLLRVLKMSIKNLVVDYRDVIPNRKPTLVVADMKKVKGNEKISKVGEEYVPAGLYHDRIIYLDINYINDPKLSLKDYNQLLIHEYAHFIADRIPRQTEPILKAEYKKMLEGFIGKPTTREALKGDRNAKMRAEVADKLGLPSEYAAADFDEWFAEIIAHWKTMPKNKNAYRFKVIMKRILTRL